jgi:hypothetical protein
MLEEGRITLKLEDSLLSFSRMPVEEQHFLFSLQMVIIWTKHARYERKY